MSPGVPKSVTAVMQSTNGVIQSSASGTYSVSITSSNSPVIESDILDVTADITNSGGSDTQTVTLDVGGTQRDSKDVSLNSSETKSVTFSWSTSDGDLGTYTAKIESTADSDSMSVDVTDTEIDTFEDGDISVYSGDTGSFSEQSSVVQSGTYALEANTDGTTKDMTATPAPNGNPQQGDRWEVYFRYTNTGDSMAHIWNFDGTKNVGVKVDPVDGDLDIFEEGVGAFVSKNFDGSAYIDQWLRGIITWYSDGVVEFELENIATMQTSTAVKDDGDGIRWSVNNRNSNTSTMYFDEAQFLTRTIGNSP